MTGCRPFDPSISASYQNKWSERDVLGATLYTKTPLISVEAPNAAVIVDFLKQILY